MRRVIAAFQAYLPTAIERSAVSVRDHGLATYSRLPLEEVRRLIAAAFEPFQASLESGDATAFSTFWQQLGPIRGQQGSSLDDMFAGINIGHDLVNTHFKQVFADDPAALAWWFEHSMEILYQGATSLSKVFVAAREQVIQHQTARWQTLAEGSRLFAETFVDQDTLLNYVSHYITEAFGDGCILSINLGERRPIVITYHRDLPMHRLLQTLGAQAEKQLDALLDMADLTKRQMMLSLLAANGYEVPLANVAIAALQAHGQRFGSLIVFRATPQPAYGPSDEALLRDLTERAALSIMNAELYRSAQLAREAAEHNADRIVRLQHVTSALSEVMTRQSVAEVILQEGMAAFGADAGIVMRLSDDGQLLTVLNHTGYDRRSDPRFREIPLMETGPTRQAVETRQIVLFQVPTETTNPLQLLQQDNGDQLMVVAPLMLKQRVLGTLQLVFRAQRLFTVEDEAFLVSLAQKCAQALEWTRLYTAEQEAREAAEAAVEHRNAFLSVASHEFRTPLTTVLGQAMLVERRLSQTSDTNPRDLRALRSIVQQTMRLNTLVNGMLDISKIETGQFQIVPAPCDLAQLTRQVVEAFGLVLVDQRIAAELPDEPVMVLGDMARLEQIMNNLLQNASKYSPTNSEIGVSLTVADGKAWLRIRDHGIGIPQEALPHLFDRFYRATNAGRVSSGMGIGLYVVGQLVQLHGGTITAESESGEGSVFTVALPLMTEAPAQANC